MTKYDETNFNPPAAVATVTLKNLKSFESVSDVSLLIDTGADITLLPKFSIDKFRNIEFLAENFELEGFDGNRSKAVAVKLQLIFLNKKFTGNFLLIEQEVGILGRDILNYLSILFDGKKLEWDEVTKA